MQISVVEGKEPAFKTTRKEDITLEEAGKLIHIDYRLHIAKEMTNRSGFLVTGCCDDEHHHYAGLSGAEMSLASADPHRTESLSEHSDGCAHLALSISMWRPNLIRRSELGRVIPLFLYHDAPEVKRGDEPDDGNRNDATKDAQEYETLCEQVEHWRAKQREELLADYRRFQRHDGRLFQVMYCIDKIEAVLRVLEYERGGADVDLRNKRDRLSAQDIRFAEEIGSYLAPDGWARHALERIRKCAGRELAYWIMVAAFRSVRGEAPEWLLRWKDMHFQ